MELPELIEPVPEVTPDETFVAVLAKMSGRADGVAAVIENRKIVGLIADHEVARHSATAEADMSALLAHDVMTTTVERMPAATPIIDAARAMRAQQIQYLALVDDRGEFVGIVSLRRVLSCVVDELDLKVDNLERELMADGPGG
jgi:arabinose-5-phosphate isomerase